MYNSSPFWRQLYGCPNLISQRDRETPVVVNSYLLCSLPFPPCLSLLPSPPSSSVLVAGTFGDSKSLAPLPTRFFFQESECMLTIIRAVSRQTSCFYIRLPFIVPSTLNSMLTQSQLVNLTHQLFDCLRSSRK